MRPNKPGSYWWEDKNGKLHTVEFDIGLQVVIASSLFGCQYYTPSEYEGLEYFKRWVGPAHPPKKLKHWGSYVEYTDIEEFDLEKYKND